MRKFLFIRLLAVLTCFVAGGLLAGMAVAGAKIEISQGNAAFGNADNEVKIVPSSGAGNKPVVISCTGDVMLASGVGSAIAANGPDYPWQDTSRLLKYSDITIANLECSVSKRGDPAPDKQFTFRAAPNAVDGAVDAGVDIFTLANNHVLDYGGEALTDTINILKGKNIKYAGAGKNEDEAYSPALMECKGIKIAVLAYSRVIPQTGWIAGKNHPGVASGYNTRRMAESIKAARGKADIVIVCMHWGKELDDFPGSDQIALAHRMIDEGADMVVGSHPHVLQGMEIYKGKLIAYSLGNFIFTSSSQEAREGAILQVVFDGKGRPAARLAPTFITSGTTTILRGNDRKRVLSRVNKLSSAFGTAVLENGTIVSLKKDGGAQ